MRLTTDYDALDVANKSAPRAVEHAPLEPLALAPNAARSPVDAPPLVSARSILTSSPPRVALRSWHHLIALVL